MLVIYTRKLVQALWLKSKLILGDGHRLSLKSKFILGDWHRPCHRNQNWFLGTGTGHVIEIKIDSWGLVQAVSLKSKLIFGIRHRLSLKSKLIFGEWHRLSLKSKLIFGDCHRPCHRNQNWFLGTGTGCSWNQNWFLGTVTGRVIEIKIDFWGLAQAVSSKSKLIFGDCHRPCHRNQNWFLGTGTGCHRNQNWFLGTSTGCVIYMISHYGVSKFQVTN